MYTQRRILEQPKQDSTFNNFVLELWKQLYADEDTDYSDEIDVHLKTTRVELMTTGLDTNYVHFSKHVSPKTKHLELTWPSQVIEKLRKYMNMITKFDDLISAFVTTSNFKASLRTYNFIRPLTSSLDPTFSMRTYSSIWPFTSKTFLPTSVLLNLQINKNVSSATNPQRTVLII